MTRSTAGCAVDSKGIATPWHLHWNVPVEATETYPKPSESSRTRHVGDGHPPLAGRGALDRFAYRLDCRTLGEVGLPWARRPAFEQVSKLVDKARPVAHSLADGPPVAAIRVGLVLGANPAHSVQARFVGALAVQQVVKPRGLEDQRARVAVDLDSEVAWAAHRRARHLEHTTGAGIEPQKGGRSVVDGDRKGTATWVGSFPDKSLRLCCGFNDRADHP